MAPEVAASAWQVEPWWLERRMLYVADMRTLILLVTLTVAFVACGSTDGSKDAGGSQFASCEGYSAHAGKARTTASQCGGEQCFAWDFEPGCPYPPQCMGDFSCSAGEVCKNDPCFHGTCVPACTGTSCEVGLECAASGHCVPIACDAGYNCGSGSTCSVGSANADQHGCLAEQCSAGYACPPNTRCDAGNPDAHGCSVLSCTASSDCDCGVCMSGACRAGPGYCGNLSP